MVHLSSPCLLRACFCCLLLAISPHLLAQFIVKGTVVNATTNEPFPFVNIGIQGSQRGTLSDEQGRFSIRVDSLNQPLLVSALGFKTLKIAAREQLSIELVETEIALAEAVVRYKNPALPIIQKAIKNKSLNDPANYFAYTFKSYSKNVVSGSIQTENLKRKKSQKQAKQLLDSEWLVNETIVRKSYLFPNQSKEIIEASTTSGSSNSTILSNLGLLLQPFGFYPDLITFKGRRASELFVFANPVSTNGLTLYNYYLKDTLTVALDTTFVVEFWPKNSREKMALKGELRINTDGYAIEEVEAEPASEGLLISFRIHQKYAKIEGRWFPTELYSDWQMPEFKWRHAVPMFKLATYISDVSFNNKLTPGDFTENSVGYVENPTSKSSDFWQQNRAVNLSEREAKTYQYFDSLSGFKKLAVGVALNASEWALAGAIPVSRYVALSTRDLFDSNIYEGFRPTLHFNSSPSFSKKWRLNTKIGYGLGDKTWKYEGAATYHFDKDRNHSLSVHYRDDVSEPGNVQYFIWNHPQIPYELIRTFLISRTDHLVQKKVELKIKVAKFGRLTVGLVDETRTPNYAYKYISDDRNLMSNLGDGFHARMVSVGYRWVLGEQFAQIGQGTTLIQPPKMVWLFNYEQGICDFLMGQFAFSKVHTKFEYVRKNAVWGDTYINFTAGKVFGSVPYSYLINGRGAKISGSFPLVWTANHFNTMGLYEFTSDQYSNLFVTHQLKELFFKSSIPWFKPTVGVSQGIAWGSLKNPESHAFIPISTLEKGYFESGITVDNLLRIKIGKVAYVGAGVGVFYRWGANRLPQPADNLVTRFVWNIGF
jgi:Family of unknown function (DUF5686)/CarboxypepD_reg-like domain